MLCNEEIRKGKKVDLKILMQRASAHNFYDYNGEVLSPCFSGAEHSRRRGCGVFCAQLRLSETDPSGPP